MLTLEGWLAKEADVLLSNLDESNTASAVVGKSNADPTEKCTQAIRFRTGSNDRGYNLTSVKAALADASESEASATLEKDTCYFVVFDSTAPPWPTSMAAIRRCPTPMPKRRGSRSISRSATTGSR